MVSIKQRRGVHAHVHLAAIHKPGVRDKSPGGLRGYAQLGVLDLGVDELGKTPGQDVGSGAGAAPAHGDTGHLGLSAWKGTKPEK